MKYGIPLSVARIEVASPRQYTLQIIIQLCGGANNEKPEYQCTTVQK